MFASIPASFALAVRVHVHVRGLASNALTLGALVLSSWVGINGAVFDQNTLGDVCLSNNLAREFWCHYLPQYSVLWRPFFVVEPLTWKNVLFIIYAVMVFTYLAYPLVRELLQQLADRAGALLASTTRPSLRDVL